MREEPKATILSLPRMDMKWFPSDFHGFDLPDDTILFLAEHGLPETVSGFLIEFGMFQRSDRCVIGTEANSEVYLEEPSGRVMLGRHNQPSWVVNSSVAQLSEYISRWENFCASTNARRATTSTDRLRLEFMEIDPIPIEESASWWRALLEDIEAGPPPDDDQF